MKYLILVVIFSLTFFSCTMRRAGSPENKILILSTSAQNGVGDFVHLAEVFKIFREKYPRINLGLKVSSSGSSSSMLESQIKLFLREQVKNMPAAASKNSFCYVDLDLKGADSASLKALTKDSCESVSGTPIFSQQDLERTFPSNRIAHLAVSSAGVASKSLGE